jgi:hypothetical protein
MVIYPQDFLSSGYRFYKTGLMRKLLCLLSLIPSLVLAQQKPNILYIMMIMMQMPSARIIKR